MRERTELSIEEIDLASVMHALADPSRLRMVAALDRAPELSCAVLGEQIRHRHGEVDHHPPPRGCSA